MAGKSRKEQLEEMLAEEPHDPFLRYGLAMEHVSAGDDATAARHFRELIAATPDYVPAYMQGGQALARSGQAAAARELWQQGVAVARQKGDSHAADEMTGMIENL
jgi:Tfp pilus assembly protein PilF